jgi:hypothetical protein
MTDESSARGDAAYRAQKNAINERNEAARKAGRAQRQAEDKKAAQKRADADRADSEGLRDTFGGSTAR